MVFVSFRIFFSDNTRVRILFFLSCKARIFFPEFNIRLYDKNSESDYFFFLHQNQNIFLEKKHNPPPFKLNGRSLTHIGMSPHYYTTNKDFTNIPYTCFLFIMAAVFLKKIYWVIVEYMCRLVSICFITV